MGPAAARVAVVVAMGFVTFGFGAAPARAITIGSGRSRLAGPAPESAPQLSSCPAGTLPDRRACVHLPSDDEGAPDTAEFMNMHHDKLGQAVVYEEIPRRPDRPADYDRYLYPVPPGLPGGHSVVSGYDLDRPDEAQRRGRKLSAVGHGGVDLPQAKGLPIQMIDLDHQQGPAEVVYVGPLFGTTVITRHSLREAGQLRDYLLLFGHLDAPAPGLAPRQALHQGDLVGYVGDTGSPELVHLHLEARRVREGVDLHRFAGRMLLSGEVSVVCDPRNVLPLK
jgi:murein DD-endopeptidase MepM/ murein hydrolase activator NlpD